MLRQLRLGGRRVRLLTAFAVQRLTGKLVGPSARRLILTLLGVTVAIMLMTTVTGVALGLSSQSAVQADNVDYWVVPEGGDLTTIAASTDGPRLGATHQLTAQLRTDSRVTYATPVLLQVVSVRNPAAETDAYVLLVGVIPPSETDTRIASLPTAPLTPGDPYYANGSYNGSWTGELVASSAAADVLNASHGDQLSVRSAPDGRSFRVTAVSEAELTTGIGATPVALVHLSELQAVTGAQNGDIADQLLVGSNDRSLRSDLDGLYPRTKVVTRSGLAARDVSATSLPIGMGIAAFVVALAIGVLFTATMMGLELSRDRRLLAVLAAIGYTDRSLAYIVAVETVCLSLLGGLIGTSLGIAGIYAVNRALTDVLGLPPVGVIRPVLVPYGLVTAGLIGVLASPYPVWLLRRSSVTEGLRS